MPKREASRPPSSRRTATPGMRPALVHRSPELQSGGASAGIQKSTFASTRSWKRAIIPASPARLARVQMQRGWAKRSSVERRSLRGTLDPAGHCAGAAPLCAAGVLL